MPEEPPEPRSVQPRIDPAAADMGSMVQLGLAEPQPVPRSRGRVPDGIPDVPPVTGSPPPRPPDRGP